MQSPEITPKSWLMIGVLGVTWGSTFMVTELALETMPPFWLAAGRIGFAAVLMTAIWRSMGGAFFTSKSTLSTALSVLTIGGFSTAFPFMLIAWGQQYTTAGFAGVSMASVGVIVLPMAHFLLPDERLTLRRLIGFGIGFVGVCVLIGAQAFDTTGSDLENAGRLACVGAAFCYGVSSILMRRLPPVDPIGLTTVLLLVAAGIVVPMAVVMEGWPPTPDAQTLAIIALLGLVPTAAASVLRVFVIRSAGPVFMSLTNYQVPVWSVVLGAVLLNEPLPPSLLLALVLILSGSCLSQWGALQGLRKRP